MLIRSVEPGEVSLLAKLARRTYAEAFGDALAPSDLRFVLERNLAEDYFRQALEEDTILVAELEDTLIGFIQFGDLRRPAPGSAADDQEIRRCYVGASFQGRGIGSRLMTATLSDRRLARASTIYLDVWDGNRRAQAFYRRHGFAVVGSRELLLASGPASGHELIMARGRPARISPGPAESSARS